MVAQTVQIFTSGRLPPAKRARKSWPTRKPMPTILSQAREVLGKADEAQGESPAGGDAKTDELLKLLEPAEADATGETLELTVKGQTVIFSPSKPVMALSLEKRFGAEDLRQGHRPQSGRSRRSRRGSAGPARNCPAELRKAASPQKPSRTPAVGTCGPGAQ